MSDGLTPGGLARLRSAAERHVGDDRVPGLTVIVLTQRMFETPEPPRVHRDIQAAAYAALG